jgi:hypothetical protein
MKMRLFLLLAVTFASAARDKIALIEFFGYQGLDVDAIRKALPVHEGGWYEDKDERAVRDAIKSIAGREPTDIASVCCEAHGSSILFIGLPGKSTREFRLDAKPTGAVHLSAELVALHADLDKAEEAAAKKGGDAPQEDTNPGYRLIKYPPARQAALQVREYALAHFSELEDVLQHSADNQQRAWAADALGYGERSDRQVAALLRACRDADDGVRDEATRALGEIVRADSSVSRQLPAALFVEMIGSGFWMDRNKAAMVLTELTNSRDPELLVQLKSQAWEPLLEMARWRSGHATGGRLILGRIQGIPEDRLLPLLFGKLPAFWDSLGIN